MLSKNLHTPWAPDDIPHRWNLLNPLDQVTPAQFKAPILIKYFVLENNYVPYSPSSPSKHEKSYSPDCVLIVVQVNHSLQLLFMIEKKNQLHFMNSFPIHMINLQENFVK